MHSEINGLTFCCIVVNCKAVVLIQESSMVNYLNNLIPYTELKRNKKYNDSICKEEDFVSV